MKPQQKKTAIFMLIGFIIVVITDAIWAANSIKADTISEFTRDSFKYTGGIFYALGFLLSHLGWYRDAKIPIAVSMVVMIIGGMLFGFIQSRLLVMPIWWVIPGVPLGHIFWPQKRPDDMRFGG